MQMELSCKNKYLSKETLGKRIIKQISEELGLGYEMSRTSNFVKFHETILEEYQSAKKKFTIDEQSHIEHVLSKDEPHTSELTKFATCWFKHFPDSARKLFAVDGFSGLHPKGYVNEAFSPTFEKHTKAVRLLYSHTDDPERIKCILDKAFPRVHAETVPSGAINFPTPSLSYDEEGNLASFTLDYEPTSPTNDGDLEMCIGLYIEEVGLEEIKRIAFEKTMRKPPPNKRKKPSGENEQEATTTP